MTYFRPSVDQPADRADVCDLFSMKSTRRYQDIMLLSAHLLRYIYGSNIAVVTPQSAAKYHQYTAK
jgi:hypothetical protein